MRGVFVFADVSTLRDYDVTCFERTTGEAAPGLTWLSSY
jgi:hypothetical protein